MKFGIEIDHTRKCGPTYFSVFLRKIFCVILSNVAVYHSSDLEGAELC